MQRAGSGGQQKGGVKWLNQRARSWATYAIKFVHPPVKEAVPGLILLLEDEDDTVRYGAKFALERIGTLRLLKL